MALARYLWLAVPGLGLLELAGHGYFATRAPELAEWQAVRAPITELRQQGELIVTAPEWADPIARHVLGDELVPLRDAARPDVSAYSRAIEVSVLGKRAPELSAWRTLSESSHGKFRLRVLENPEPAQVVFDFVDNLGPERVEVHEQAGGPRPCRFQPNAGAIAGGLHSHPTFPSQRFQCGGGSYFFVGVTVIDDERYRPRRCIWAHPTPRGPLRIHYRQVPLGKVIRGYAGLPWFIMRDGLGPPVDLEIRVDGQSIGTFSHRDEAGWEAFSMSTGAHAGRTADVEFLVSASVIRDRHYCFYADTR